MKRNISLHKSSLCGIRPQNEDVERYNLNLSIKGESFDPAYAAVDFFAVCDGHGGSEVSKFVTPLLEKYLMRKDLQFPLPMSYINKVYSQIQQEVVQHPKKIGAACGSTALVMLRYLDRDYRCNVQIINLGDCRAILSRKGLPIPLSKDHKPYWPDEKRRIDKVNQKYGTNIQVSFSEGDWRIGDLSVSRSFGDLDNAPFISHYPDAFNYRLESNDEFIVLSCDGLTDVMENHEIVNFIRDNVTHNHLEMYEIPGKYPSKEVVVHHNVARKLAEYALACDSGDNVSVLIIFLNN